MRTFECITHCEPSLGGREYRARLVVRAGIPSSKDGIVSLSPGVERGQPVVVISQCAGDDRTGQGSQLQAIHPADARALAAMLLRAADETDRLVAADPTVDGDARIAKLETELTALRRVAEAAQAVINGLVPALSSEAEAMNWRHARVSDRLTDELARTLNALPKEGK